MCMMRGCTQQDLLPSKCGKCRRVYCTAHIPYAEHKCQAHKDATALTCPLCNAVVPQRDGEDPNISVSRHMDGGCRDQPTMSNGPTYNCSFGACMKIQPVRMLCDRCGYNFCVEHRTPAHHRCAAKTPPPAAVKVTTTDTLVPTGKVDVSQFRNTARTALGKRTDDSIIARVFLAPEFNSAPFFLYIAPKASVGRILDDICTMCGVRNENNKPIPESDKLFLWASGPHSAGKEVPAPLQTSASIGTVVGNDEVLLLSRGSELPEFAAKAVKSIPPPKTNMTPAQALVHSAAKPSCKVM